MAPIQKIMYFMQREICFILSCTVILSFYKKINSQMYLKENLSYLIICSMGTEALKTY